MYKVKGLRERHAAGDWSHVALERIMQRHAANIQFYLFRMILSKNKIYPPGSQDMWPCGDCCSVTMCEPATASIGHRYRGQRNYVMETENLNVFQRYDHRSRPCSKSICIIIRGWQIRVLKDSKNIQEKKLFHTESKRTLHVTQTRILVNLHFWLIEEWRLI